MILDECQLSLNSEISRFKRPNEQRSYRLRPVVGGAGSTCKTVGKRHEQTPAYPNSLPAAVCTLRAI